MGGGSGNAELADPAVRAGPQPFVVHPGPQPAGIWLAAPAISMAAAWPSVSTRPGSHVTVHPPPPGRQWAGYPHCGSGHW